MQSLVAARKRSKKNIRIIVYKRQNRRMIVVYKRYILKKNTIYTHGKQIIKLANTYFLHEGLPETVGMKEPRSWMSNLFSKIFFGDLVARYRIRNDYALRVMIRKMAESIKQPLSYNRIARLVK